MNRELMNTNEPDAADAATTPDRTSWRFLPAIRRIANLRCAGGVLLCFMLLLAPVHALAHDPYEITSNIRLETNRTEVEIEMELAAAMLLAGVERPRADAEPATMFAAALPELRRQAAQFFVISSPTGQMSATQTNVELGVENHVKFTLHYPPASGLRISAAGLKKFGGQSPFGTSVTVLDMVNMKVLGQSTLFANSPAAEFAPAVKAEAATTGQLQGAAAVNNPAPGTPPPAPATTAPVVCCNGRWVLLVAGVLGVISIWLLRKRK